MAKQQQKKKTSTRRTKKAKVFVPAEKIILFCAVLFAVCAVLLAVTSFIDTPMPKIEAPIIAKAEPNGKALAAAQTKQNAPKYDTQIKTKNTEFQTQRNASEQNYSNAESKGKRNVSTTLPPPEKPRNTQTAEAPAPKNTPPKADMTQTAAKSAPANKPTAPIAGMETQPSPPSYNSLTLTQTVPSSAVSSPDSAKKTNNAASIPAEKQTEIASVKASVPEAAQKPVPVFDIPQAVNAAVLVFVFDDAGLNPENVKSYASLPFPVTIAVLPKLSHSRECAEVTRASGNEVILHQPMQAVNLKVNPGPGAILPDMSTFEIAAVLKENLSEIGPVKGLNNHEGSLITQDIIKIGTVLDVADETGVFFLDSRTTAETKAPQAALERGMKIYERDVFIDDVVTRRVMLSEIYRGIAIANKKGAAIMIGHVDKSVGILPALLRDLYPHLVKNGYRFSTVSNSPVKTQ
ncbi:MAG: divergent polysaccharide deacetylase family protein [Treponema sp.]